MSGTNSPYEFAGRDPEDYSSTEDATAAFGETRTEPYALDEEGAPIDQKLAEYNAKFLHLIQLNTKKQVAEKTLSDLKKQLEAAKEDVLEAMFENDNKAAEELGGFRVSRSARASVSFNKESSLDEAIELSKDLGFDDAVSFNAQRMTTHCKRLFPEAFDGQEVDLAGIDATVRKHFNVYSKPTISIRKKGK